MLDSGTIHSLLVFEEGSRGEANFGSRLRSVKWIYWGSILPICNLCLLHAGTVLTVISQSTQNPVYRAVDQCHLVK